MESDDLPFKKLKKLLEGDHLHISLQLRVASMYMIIYEDLRDTIEQRVTGFFANDWELVDGKLLPTELSEEYRTLLRGKSKFKACRDFLREFGATSSEDEEFIVKFISYRGEVAHRLYWIMLDDNEPELDLEMLIQALSLSVKIERWWIKNIELPTNPDFDGIDVSLDEIEPGRHLFLRQLIRVAFQDVLDASESRV
ncbi:hypothetical protein H6M51_10125 [Rhizobium sp. AQ_MP]|uniref:hypothetical protein n=1 Tax=Rhizobium sp. AQ_MP TaxID=2761536 RepID=UPI001639F004|nr:hypothetical protein [Rhizobium sp. AQ_MP]MBC2773221.1 hypothetical protein [Rhizobium sp. AQ_MP]